MIDRYTYVVTTDRDHAAVAAAVEEKAREKGFRVLVTHDVQAMLAEKGFQRGPLRIIEVCNARAASQVLAADDLVSVLMPCRVSVYTRDGKTVVALLRPAAIAEFFTGTDLGTVPTEIDEVMRSIVDEAAGVKGA